jgi:sarcosine oxidase
VSETFDYAVIGLGALGSATVWQLARRGHHVVGLEQFALGHENGASHDSSRIIRHSYHTTEYVELTKAAYRDWSTLEADAGEELVTITGGLDLYPPAAALSPAPYLAAMRAAGVGFDVLDVPDVRSRWPQFVLPPGTQTVYQGRTGIVPAARGVAACQRLARHHGADLRDHTPVTGIHDSGASRIEIDTDAGTIHADALVITADAWTNDLLAHLDWRVPLTVTQEQVTYFDLQVPGDFSPDRSPVWIWMDDPSYYGFPTYGEATIKAAEDCGGPVVDARTRTFAPDPDREARLASFVHQRLHGVGAVNRSKTCLYTLTPDRDFVIGPVPGHPRVHVGLGAAHGFKFTPTFGRLLADLATSAVSETPIDLSTFRLDRPALTRPGHPTTWLV